MGKATGGGSVGGGGGGDRGSLFNITRLWKHDINGQHENSACIQMYCSKLICQDMEHYVFRHINKYIWPC